MTHDSNITRRTALALAGAASLLPRTALGAAPTSRDLKDDMHIVRRALHLHPGLYRYHSPRDVEGALGRLDAEFGAAETLERQFLLLSAFMATIRCGHSQCNPYNQRKAVVKSLFERPTRLPFEFDWIDGRMIVLADRSRGAPLLPGTEIVSINGMKAAELLRTLLPFARADGGNDAKRVAQMAMLNTDRFETFDIFQGLLLPPVDGRFQLRYRTPDGRSGKAEVAAITQEDRLATRHTLETDGTSAPFWTWEMRGDVAVLTMPSWVMYNSRWDWQSWLRERLDSLRGAKGMIVDLRENEGGNECGNVILSRLAGKDLRFAGYRQRVRYRTTPKDLDPYLDTWDDSFRSIGAGGKDVGNGFFELGIEETDVIPASGPALGIPVAALIGPTCSSATFSFARRARESGLVRLFGTMSGGNLRGINGNGYFFVRLPASGLEFDLPIVGNFPTRPRPDHGVMPDVQVVRTARDIASGRDPCLQAAMSWVERL